MAAYAEVKEMYTMLFTVLKNDIGNVHSLYLTGP